MLVVATGRALGRRPGSKASAGSLRMAEQLSADPAVVEAGVGAPVRLALGVEGEPGPREAGGALELVPPAPRLVVQTRGCGSLQEVAHLLDGTG